jgi:glycosyltransferase involved in cell wall biosynthesis
MKIIEVVFNWPAETFIQRHVTALADQMLNPILVARHADAVNVKSASIQKTDFSSNVMPNFDRISTIQKIVNLKYLFQANQLGKYSGYKVRDRVLLAYFKSLKPDLIHFHFGTLAGMMWWIPVELGIPYTLSLRGSDIQVQPLVSADGEKQLRQAINHAAGIHTVCESLWIRAQPYLEHEIHHKTIYTTVPQTDTFLEKGHVHSGVHFVSVGRFHWTKNYIDLLKAFRHFLDRGFNARLTIIGDGPDMESLLYWISVLRLQKEVLLPGNLPYDGISEIFARADAFIQSSIAEGFSNAVAEAMALGLPVFATNVGGAAEIIQDGVIGILLDPYCPEEWWQALQRAFDQDLMQRISRNARQTAKALFSAEKHAQDFIHFYQQALNG